MSEDQTTYWRTMKQQAVAGSADDSATKRLDQHISIARDQRDTFLAAIGRLHTTDQQSADTLTNGGGI